MGDRVKLQPGHQQSSTGSNRVGAERTGPARKCVRAHPKTRTSQYGDEGLPVMPLGLKNSQQKSSSGGMALLHDTETVRESFARKVQDAGKRIVRCVSLCDTTDCRVSLVDPQASLPAHIHCLNRSLGSDCRQGYRNLRAAEDFPKPRLVTSAT